MMVSESLSCDTPWSFSDLWNHSKTFRQIFFHQNLIRSRSEKDVAESYWCSRYPRIEWQLCGVDNCKSLVPHGEVCTKHVYVGGKLPSWSWSSGHLYHLVMDCSTENRYEKFVRYDRYTWETNYHYGIPRGYVIRYIDQNPLNLHLDNLVLLSKISASAYDNHVLSIGDAVDLDSSLPDDILQRVCDGRRKGHWAYSYRTLSEEFGISQRKAMRDTKAGKVDMSSLRSILSYVQGYASRKQVWSYSANDLADAAGVSYNAIQQATHRGSLRPENLTSVVRYCSDHSLGGPKARHWIYHSKDIADAANTKQNRVDDAIRSGKLHPDRLSSVVEYCLKKREKSDKKSES